MRTKVGSLSCVITFVAGSLGCGHAPAGAPADSASAAAAETTSAAARPIAAASGAAPVDGPPNRLAKTAELRTDAGIYLAVECDDRQAAKALADAIVKK